jgi:RIP metalloprotease RseP
MGAVILIGGLIVAIVIHEGGHFVAAKYFDMKATKAFFGFGPKIWSMHRGETEYGIRALPLGGYVKIIGMSPTEEVEPEDVGRTYREKPFWQKAVVVLAGVASHFVIALALMYVLVLAYGERRATTEVEGVSPIIIREIDVDGTIPLDIRRSDIVLAIDGQAPDAWVDSEKRPGDLTSVMVERDGSRLILETTDRVEPTPAALSEIRVGDKLVEMGGTPIEKWSDFVRIAVSHPDTSVDVVVDRNGALASFETTLTNRETQSGDIVGFFGVWPVEVTESVGPISAVGHAGSDFGFAVWLSIKGLWGVVAGFGELLGAAVGDAEVPVDRPISPIGLARISGPVEVGLRLLAFVNVFVGILNFMPLVPLDGGLFAVAVYEKVRKKPADTRYLAPVSVAVFMFIMLLGLLGFYFDIVDPIRLE